MFRVLLLLVAGLTLSGCLSREAMQELRAKEKARIEAAKIPEVQLSEAQSAKIRELAPRAQVVWLRAGRQSDGKIFVCHVATNKTLFGRTAVGLWTGTFESDGSYQRSPAYLWSATAILQECHARGFEPPVSITTSVTVVRI